MALLAAVVTAGTLLHPAATPPLWLAPAGGRWLEAPGAQVWLAVQLRVSVPADAPLGYLPTYLVPASVNRGPGALASADAGVGTAAGTAGAGVAVAPPDLPPPAAGVHPVPGDGEQPAWTEGGPPATDTAAPGPAAGPAPTGPVAGGGEGDDASSDAEAAQDFGGAPAGARGARVQNWPVGPLHRGRGPLRARAVRR